MLPPFSSTGVHFTVPLGRRAWMPSLAVDAIDCRLWCDTRTIWHSALDDLRSKTQEGRSNAQLRSIGERQAAVLCSHEFRLHIGLRYTSSVACLPHAEQQSREPTRWCSIPSTCVSPSPALRDIPWLRGSGPGTRRRASRRVASIGAPRSLRTQKHAQLAGRSRRASSTKEQTKK